MDDPDSEILYELMVFACMMDHIDPHERDRSGGYAYEQPVFERRARNALLALKGMEPNA